MPLTRIEAVLRPEKLEPLRQHLEKVGYPGMMVTEVEGHGKQRGVEQQWRGARYQTHFLPKIKVEIIVSDASAKKIIATIIDVCNTGSVGDGKIFTSTVKDAIRIRTQEKGAKAL